MPLPPLPHEHADRHAHPHLPPQPISPVLPSLAHNRPVNKKKSLLTAVLIGTIITGLCAGALSFFNISIEVILPVLAPIWVGSITLIYSVNSKS
ncbi:MAG: hypothetical protein HUU49_01680 [Candidatus Buchananbacteria bacterium]|nr:hypothetical protein [Candidatus Buchananbacteria bacterium]